MLENDELNQLLQKSADLSQSAEMLSEDEKSIIVGLFKEPLNSAGKSIKKVLNKECTITEITADIAKASLIKETLGEEYYLKDVVYKTGLSAFAFDNESVRKMASLLLEVIPEEGPLSETEVNSFGEIFSGFVTALGNGLSKEIDGKVEPEESAGESKIVDLEENVLQLSIGLVMDQEINTNIYYYISYPVVNAIIGAIKSKVKIDEPKSDEKNEAKEEEMDEENAAAVHPIQFEELTEDLIADEKENMNLLMDLQLQVSVELGKVKRPIKDILQFTQGTIVELDRLAGDNVDILVSGKIIAKGEVVVVDQNFGVRITKIVLPEKRV